MSSMWIIAVPLIVIVFILLALGGTISESLSINIMPFFSVVFLILGIVSAVNIFRDKEKNEEQVKVHIIMTIIFGILFMLTCAFGTTSIGDILTWLWYHI